jgi:hypothetical protein
MQGDSSKAAALSKIQGNSNSKLRTTKKPAASCGATLRNAARFPEYLHVPCYEHIMLLVAGISVAYLALPSANMAGL